MTKEKVLTESTQLYTKVKIEGNEKIEVTLPWLMWRGAL